jgi:glycosyltransferase involved in cell wall biosynthesis
MKATIVVPMFNEEDNVKKTATEIAKAMKGQEDWELILVDDGSTDQTLKVAKQLAQESKNICVVAHPKNYGRGKALRTGFAQAKGDFVATLDADLSYHPDYIPKMIEILQNEPDVDIVVGSPYMAGGKTAGVSYLRIFLSKLGNKILSLTMPYGIRTFTGILRAYRKEVLDSLELQEDGKEIHLEILSKALALGYQVKEIPATLTARKKGKSKFKLSATVTSHLLFSIFERPAVYLSLAGLILIFLGLLSGSYIIYLWRQGTLNPNRPLIILMVLFLLTGTQIVIFGILSSQLIILRNEIYRIQKENLNLRKKFEREKISVER